MSKIIGHNLIVSYPLHNRIQQIAQTLPNGKRLRVTSTDRPADKGSNHSKPGFAVDWYIETLSGLSAKVDVPTSWEIAVKLLAEGYGVGFYPVGNGFHVHTDLRKDRRSYVKRAEGYVSYERDCFAYFAGLEEISQSSGYDLAGRVGRILPRYCKAEKDNKKRNNSVIIIIIVVAVIGFYLFVKRRR